MPKYYRLDESWQKAASLMERLDKLGTGMPLTENYKNRRQVTRDEILDVLNKTNDNQSNNELWASITYVKPAAVYKGGTRGRIHWRKDDVTKALAAHPENNTEKWYQDLDKYNQTDLSENNPITGVIALQKYVLHWLTPEKFKKKYGEYADKLHKLRMDHGLAVDSDGLMGDNRNPRAENDYGTQFNQTTGNQSIDINTKGANFTGYAYLIDDNGNILRDGSNLKQIPYDVLKSMTAKSRDYTKPEKDAVEQLAPEILAAYVKARTEIINTFSPRNLKFAQILCIAAFDGEQSFYYINDKVTTNKGAVFVNQQDMVELAEQQLDEVFTGINDFATKDSGERYL